MFFFVFFVLFQDLVASATIEQCNTMARAFHEHMFELATSAHGSRVVKTLLGRLPEKSEERIGMVMQLLGEDGATLFKLACDEHGR
jgi:hypothetical protein